LGCGGGLLGRAFGCLGLVHLVDGDAHSQDGVALRGCRRVQGLKGAVGGFPSRLEGQVGKRAAGCFHSGVHFGQVQALFQYGCGTRNGNGLRLCVRAGRSGRRGERTFAN
jgi:hypothetical protein